MFMVASYPSITYSILLTTKLIISLNSSINGIRTHKDVYDMYHGARGTGQKYALYKII